MQKITFKEFINSYINSQEARENYQNFLLAQEGDIHQEHDKIIKRILRKKEEAVRLINETIKPAKLYNSKELELYNGEFITKYFELRDADMVYKLKNKEIYFLIEHQSRIDYSMPYRIFKYKTEILENCIDKKALNNKKYVLPLIVAIVLYTGQYKWKVNQKMEDRIEKLETILINKPIWLDSFYALVDINNYTKEMLLQGDNLLEKIMLIEKSRTPDELMINSRLVILKLKEEEKLGKTNGENKKEIERYIKQVVSKKNGSKETEKILRELKRGSEEKMGMAVFDMLDREYEKMRREGMAAGIKEGIEEGIKEGIKEGRKEVAKKLMEMDLTLEQIIKATGLTERELKEMK